MRRLISPPTPPPDDADWSALALGRPPEVGTSDRIRWAVVMAGALDPLRADLRPEAVIRTARRLTASMVDVLPGTPRWRVEPANGLDGDSMDRGDAWPRR